MPPSSFEQDYFRKTYGNDYEKRNPVRKLDYCLSRIREGRPSGTLLDVGCAYGLFLSRARRFYDVTGCDVSEHAVGAARERFPDLEWCCFFRDECEEMETGVRMRGDRSPFVRPQEVISVSDVETMAGIYKLLRNKSM
jgi:SAM-dependent methyltransferase